jgi:hypothetical protein
VPCLPFVNGQPPTKYSRTQENRHSVASRPTSGDILKIFVESAQKQHFGFVEIAHGSFHDHPLGMIYHMCSPYQIYLNVHLAGTFGTLSIHFVGTSQNAHILFLLDLSGIFCVAGNLFRPPALPCLRRPHFFITR